MIGDVTHSTRTARVIVGAIALISTVRSDLAAKSQGKGVVANEIESNGAKILPNGWRITPAGKTIPLPGDMPLKMVVTPDGKSLLVNTGGWHDHTINVISLQSRVITASLQVAKDWAGLAYDSSSGTIYVSGGGPGAPDFPKLAKRYGAPAAAIDSLQTPILRVRFDHEKLTQQSGVSIPDLSEKERFIAGVALSKDRSLYVVNLQTDTVYHLSQNGDHLLATGKVGYRPYAAAFSPDFKTLAVSNWGDESVSLLDPDTLKERNRIKTGSHPNELCFAKDGRLFVANAGANTVSVIENGAVTETIRTSLDPNAPVGSTPVALAITADSRFLFAANADNNDVAMISIANRGDSEVLGFIPTGWYPSALAVSSDGKKLFVGTAKGMGFGSNVPSKTAFGRTGPSSMPFDYIGALLGGAVSEVEIPNKIQLEAYTKQVRANVPVPSRWYDKHEAERIQQNAFSKIKHVLYIIRENRTYDQVFGDLGYGNGDPSLVFFGRQVTPNAHMLVKKYVTLDNLYSDGEVSEDGHQWTDSAWATDFTQKAWINSYSRRGEPEADERLTASPAGYLWDNCARHNLTFRAYGEGSSFRSTPDNEPTVRVKGMLAEHFSLAWLKNKQMKDSRDTERAKIFIDELKQAEETAKWPNFMVMSLGEDHTQGLVPGAFTPSAHVAANDQALGMIVDAVSHSKFWRETAIFVIEDDAQNGPDHVDAHRTVGLVVSPYVKRNSLDSTMYTTSSMVHTIELILGLPTMTQFDHAATPMYNAFTTTPDFTPIDCVEPQIDLMTRNPDKGPGAQASLKLDFSDYDRADPDELNRILWTALKPGVPMPAPVRSGHFR
jgi:YVTN family beta-propeller protein